MWKRLPWNVASPAHSFSFFPWPQPPNPDCKVDLRDRMEGCELVPVLPVFFVGLLDYRES